MPPDQQAKGLSDAFPYIPTRVLIEFLLALVRAEIVGRSAISHLPSGCHCLLLIRFHATHRIPADRSINSGSGQFHPAFGIDEEVARDDDPLSGLEPVDDFDAVADAPAGLHLPGFEEPVAPVDKDGLPEPRVRERHPQARRWPEGS